MMYSKYVNQSFYFMLKLGRVTLQSPPISANFGFLVEMSVSNYPVPSPPSHK